MKDYYIFRDGQPNELGPVTVSVRDDAKLSEYELKPDVSLRYANHSPTGFEFGYGGSGPAQLALAILIDFTEIPKYALTQYQEFKREFIAGLKHPGGVITGEDIEKWLSAEA